MRPQNVEHRVLPQVLDLVMAHLKGAPYNCCGIRHSSGCAMTSAGRRFAASNYGCCDPHANSVSGRGAETRLPHAISTCFGSTRPGMPLAISTSRRRCDSNLGRSCRRVDRDPVPGDGRHAPDAPGIRVTGRFNALECEDYTGLVRQQARVLAVGVRIADDDVQQSGIEQFQDFNGGSRGRAP
jgi:hypothetical protein